MASSISQNFARRGFLFIILLCETICAKHWLLGEKVVKIPNLTQRCLTGAGEDMRFFKFIFDHLKSTLQVCRKVYYQLLTNNFNVR